MPQEKQETWSLFTMGLNVVSTVAIALVLKELFLLNPQIPVTGLVVFHVLSAFLMTNCLWFMGKFELPAWKDINWKYLLVYSFFQVFISCFFFPLTDQNISPPLPFLSLPFPPPLPSPLLSPLSIGYLYCHRQRKPRAQLYWFLSNFENGCDSCDNYV